MDNQHWDLIESLHKAKSLPEIEHVFAGVVKSMGVDQFFYYNCQDVDTRYKSFNEDFPVLSYPQEFLEIYMKEQFVVIDPVIHECTATRLPVNWSSVKAKRNSILPEQYRILEIAIDHGIETGFTVPVFSNQGVLNGVTFALENEKDFNKLINQKQNNFLVISLLLHNMIQPALTENKANLITKKQLESLRFLAEGLSSKQISGKMKIREDTVNKHIQSLKEKLCAKNRVELIVKAIKLGLFDL